MAEDTRPYGLRLLRAAALLVIGLALAATTWTVVKAIQNPDVRARRPRWLDASDAFDASFWLPLVMTLVIGFGLVLLVFARALRRLRSGEDLYANRFGRGIRRRGEQHLSEDEA
ncbi:MAG: hypothetical protein HKN04_04090 [Rhodothermaceae bacterium]|nr:hypothetical protein [Rhodothermaceae bacterium]